MDALGSHSVGQRHDSKAPLPGVERGHVVEEVRLEYWEGHPCRNAHVSLDRSMAAESAEESLSVDKMDGSLAEVPIVDCHCTRSGPAGMVHMIDIHNLESLLDQVCHCKYEGLAGMVDVPSIHNFQSSVDQVCRQRRQIDPNPLLRNLCHLLPLLLVRHSLIVRSAPA